uniref:Uncharacterized protein n=1 Tax=Arundo donax TaxID=35708 RepID=A0A0A8Y9M6_ARUDO
MMKQRIYVNCLLIIAHFFINSQVLIAVLTYSMYYWAI